MSAMRVTENHKYARLLFAPVPGLIVMCIYQIWQGADGFEVLFMPVVLIVALGQAFLLGTPLVYFAPPRWCVQWAPAVVAGAMIGTAPWALALAFSSERDRAALTVLAFFAFSGGFGGALYCAIERRLLAVELRHRCQAVDVETRSA